MTRVHASTPLVCQKPTGEVGNTRTFQGFRSTVPRAPLGIQFQTHLGTVATVTQARAKTTAPMRTAGVTTAGATLTHLARPGQQPVCSQMFQALLKRWDTATESVVLRIVTRTRTL
jgi:hypothetical protein